MMQFCFPTIYWKFTIGKIDFGNLETKCIADKYFYCNVKNSRSLQYDWNNFLEKIKPCFLELPYLNHPLPIFSDPWMNVYNKGSYQEAHQHVSQGHHLSYCYFSKLPKGGGEFCFMNEQFRNYSANQLTSVLNLNIVDWAFPDVKEGDLLIFPSFLIHQVTYHSIEESRITVSGNVRYPI